MARRPQTYSNTDSSASRSEVPVLQRPHPKLEAPRCTHMHTLSTCWRPSAIRAVPRVLANPDSNRPICAQAGLSCTSVNMPQPDTLATSRSRRIAAAAPEAAQPERSEDGAVAGVKDDQHSSGNKWTELWGRLHNSRVEPTTGASEPVRGLHLLDLDTALRLYACWTYVRSYVREDSAPVSVPIVKGCDCRLGVKACAVEIAPW